jgi:hypothetical protein
MVTNETEVRAAFAAGNSAPTQEALDQFAADMRTKGIDPTGTLARHAVQQPGGPDARPDLQPSINAATGVRDLTPAEMATGADTLRKFWTGDQAELDAALAQAGAPMVNDTPDTRTDAEREFDNSSLGVPVDPSEYDLLNVFVSREGLSSNELPALAGSIREALGSFGVPRALGPATATDFLDAIAEAKWLEGQPEVVQQSYILEQRTMVGRVLKVDYPEVIAAIKPYVDRLSPASKAWLGSSGAVNRAQTLIRLYQTVTLQNYRKGMGGKS